MYSFLRVKSPKERAMGSPGEGPGEYSQYTLAMVFHVASCYWPTSSVHGFWIWKWASSGIWAKDYDFKKKFTCSIDFILMKFHKEQYIMLQRLKLHNKQHG